MLSTFHQWSLRGVGSFTPELCDKFHLWWSGSLFWLFRVPSSWKIGSLVLSSEVPSSFGDSSTTSSDTAIAATDSDLQRGSSVCIGCRTFHSLALHCQDIPHQNTPPGHTCSFRNIFSKMGNYNNHCWGTLSCKLFNDPMVHDPMIQWFNDGFLLMKLGQWSYIIQ